jgi:hypothetical protein|nr:MAG TPA: hypothetical protein [Caudoviricetes sp.]
MITQNERYAHKLLKELEEIYTAVRTNTITFSKTEAAKIIGSRCFLEKLVATGKIRMNKPSDRQAGAWKCNAEDVLRYANYKKRAQA